MTQGERACESCKSRKSIRAFGDKPGTYAAVLSQFDDVRGAALCGFCIKHTNLGGLASNIRFNRSGLTLAKAADEQRKGRRR